MEFVVTKVTKCVSFCWVCTWYILVRATALKIFKEGVSLVVDSLPFCRSSKRVNSSVRLELCTVFCCTFPRLHYRYMWWHILTSMFFPKVLTDNSYLWIIWLSKLCRCEMFSCSSLSLNETAHVLSWHDSTLSRPSPSSSLFF